MEQNPSVRVELKPDLEEYAVVILPAVSLTSWSRFRRNCVWGSSSVTNQLVLHGQIFMSDLLPHLFVTNCMLVFHSIQLQFLSQCHHWSCFLGSLCNHIQTHQEREGFLVCQLLCLLSHVAEGPAHNSSNIMPPLSPWSTVEGLNFSYENDAKICPLFFAIWYWKGLIFIRYVSWVVISKGAYNTNCSNVCNAYMIFFVINFSTTYNSSRYRYLTMGFRFMALSFYFVLGNNTISITVADTTKAAWECLHQEYISVPNEAGWGTTAHQFHHL